ALAALLALALAGVAAVIVYWRLYLLGPAGDPFTRGPYLLRVEDTAAELRWTVRGDAPVEVVARDAAGRTVAARGGRLTGLTPGTRYTWAASVAGTARAAGAFTTPAPDPSRPVRLAVIADYGTGGDAAWAVARTLAADAPDLAVTAGDNSYLTAAGILLDRNVFRPLAEVMRHAPVHVGVGDHDRLPPGDGALRAAFDVPPSGRYVVAHGTVQIVMLGVSATGPAVAFARRALRQPGFTRRFVVVHRPVRAGDAILPVLRAARVDAVLAGHVHRYERRTVGGVRMFTVGTGGARLHRPGSSAGGDAEVTIVDHGHLLVHVARTRVVYTFVDARGRTRDRVTAP
ncbi:MAG: metallophosphoesterase, partial [Actinomycetota bacterium]